MVKANKKGISTSEVSFPGFGRERILQTIEQTTDKLR